MEIPLAVVSDVSDLLWLVKQFGPFLIAVLFFMWRDWQREDRLTTRINELEDEQRKVVMPLVEKCAAVIAQNTAAIERLERALEKQGNRRSP